jgi:aspartyl-tRNA(Asn)/glutamyl-tRNA(Gln) amidotransferase subunit A
MSDDILSLTADELVAQYRNKRLSPVETVQAALDRIARLNPIFNAFVMVDEARALKDARASEVRWQRGEPAGLADGIPATVKDLIVTEGWPTLRGSRTIDPKQPWTEDGPPVARMREQGAVFLGKTTTSEFGWKGVTDSPLTGITRNPWNPKMTPGGSSGGSAAAVAAGMGPLTVGTDGGGSIRIPCSFTGLFGLKPSFGRVPAWPLSPMGTVAHLGPMTRTVADAALMMNVLSLPDARDWHALPHEPRDYRIGLEDGVKGLRIAYSADLGYAKVEREIAALVQQAVKRFAELGARVEQVHPGFDNAGPIFAAHWFAGAAALIRSLPAAKRRLLDPGLLEVARQGSKIGTLDYLAAVQQRGALGTLMNRFHEKYDLLLTPTLPLAAFEAGKEVAHVLKEKRWTDWSPFSYPFNLTQQPAASIPCGLTKKGLPVGLHIVGPRYADALVLRAARAFEATTPIRMPDLSKLRR